MGMDSLSQETIEQAADGDHAAFKEVYLAGAQFVYNVAFRILNHHQSAEEVVQEVFVQVYKKLKDFQFKSSLKTWLYRVTVNNAINYAKRMNKHQNTLEYDDTRNENDPEVQENIDKEYHQDVISKLLSLLNPDQRVCVVLRSIEGLSYQQIADVLKIPVNTVRTRIKRGREILMAQKKEVMLDEL